MEIKYNITPSHNEISLTNISCTYTQADSESRDDYNELTLTLKDEGGGPYFSIKTEQWACDNIGELISLLSDFEKRVGLKF